MEQRCQRKGNQPSTAAVQLEKATASSPQLLQADLDEPLLCAFGVCQENADTPPAAASMTCICEKESMAKECQRKGRQGEARRQQLKECSAPSRAAAVCCRGSQFCVRWQLQNFIIPHTVPPSQLVRLLAVGFTASISFT